MTAVEESLVKKISQMSLFLAALLFSACAKNGEKAAFFPPSYLNEEIHPDEVDPDVQLVLPKLSGAET